MSKITLKGIRLKTNKMPGKSRLSHLKKEEEEEEEDSFTKPQLSYDCFKVWHREIRQIISKNLIHCPLVPASLKSGMPIKVKLNEPRRPKLERQNSWQ